MIRVVSKRLGLALALALSSTVGFADAQEVPTRNVVPTEVVQESIRVLHPTTNVFIVQWTYTAVAATNVLAFFTAHEGQEVRTMVGDYKSSPYKINFKEMTQEEGSYEEWKNRWLKRRTDKLIVSDGEEANKVLTGLRSK